MYFSFRVICYFNLRMKQKGADSRFVTILKGY